MRTVIASRIVIGRKVLEMEVAGSVDELVQMVCQAGLVLRCDPSCTPFPCGMIEMPELWTQRQHDVAVAEFEKRDKVQGTHLAPFFNFL